MSVLRTHETYRLARPQDACTFLPGIFNPRRFYAAHIFPRWIAPRNNAVLTAFSSSDALSTLNRMAYLAEMNACTRLRCSRVEPVEDSVTTYFKQNIYARYDRIRKG